MTSETLLCPKEKNDLDIMAQTADLLWEKPHSAVGDISDRTLPNHVNSSQAVVTQSPLDGELIQQIVKLKSSHREETSALRSDLQKVSERLESMQSEFKYTIRSLRSELNSLKYQYHREAPQYQPF